MLHFHDGRVADACSLVERCHYSGRAPSNIQFVGSWHEDGGLFGDDGNIVAACFFSIPPTRWSEDVWELSRLVRLESIKCNLTGLISATVKHISKTRQCGLLVSFADATHGHHGGVYQAASWKYDGQRERNMDGLMVNGVFVPGRSCNSRWGTRSPTKLADRLPGQSVEPHYDEGKHLYWRAVSRAGVNAANRLGLASLPYPKPRLTLGVNPAQGA